MLGLSQPALRPLSCIRSFPGQHLCGNGRSGLETGSKDFQVASADLTAVSLPSPAKRAFRQPWRWLPFLSILVLGLPTLLYPYGRDQAMFAYVGSVWRQGGLPYRDAWDVKLPGIYAIYALVGGVEWGPRLLDLLASAVTAGALLWIGRSHSSSHDKRLSGVGLLAVVLAVVYTLGAFDFWNLAQTETLIAPLSAMAVALGLSRRPFAAGLCAGCAAVIKTTAVVSVVPVLLCCWLVADEDGDRFAVHRVVLTAAGWLIPALVIVIYFGTRGGLPYLGELIATQREYAGGDPRLLGHSLFDLVSRLGLAGYLPLVLLSAVGAAWSFVRQLRSGPARRVTPEWVLLAWWGIALVQVAVQRRFYLYHWAVLTPPAAWFAAEWLVLLWSQRSRHTVSRLILVSGCAAMLGLALAPRWPSWCWATAVFTGRMSVSEYRARHTGVFGYDVRSARQAAEHIRRGSGPSDPVLVLGFEPEVYLYAGRYAPTRQASEAPIFGETSIREARRKAWFSEMLADLKRNPPLYLVDRDVPHVRPSWFAPLRELMARDYRCEATYGPFRVYRRLPGSGAPLDAPSRG